MTRLRHGKSHSRAYSVWESMRGRCYNPNNAAYENYGGRGITVCERWQRFDEFYADMGDPPAECSLDRIDNDGGYSPENCRWASRLEQSRNRRGLRMVVIDGVEKAVWEWSELSGIKSCTIRARLKAVWPANEAVFSPLVPQRDRHGVRWSDDSRKEAA